MTYTQDDTKQDKDKARDEGTRDLGYTTGEDTQRKGGTSTAQTPEAADEKDYGAVEDDADASL